MTRIPWYKEAVFYELRVRSFFDSNGDGVGDIQGLIQKLDYLADLGVTTLWLLPFYPSPLRDDGYDISDYRNVHPAVGSLDDFRELVREAHRRGLRIVSELVLNHTSDQHEWFQRARRAPAGSVERDFYVWSDTPERYPDARVIFTDYEASNWTWDPVARAYFWHRFFSHQPDLNFDNPAVREALFGVVDFWFELGVDGLRLDAVPYLFERDGTNCENLPETHAFLRELRRHVDGKFSERMLLAEANQWPEDAVAYFGAGDECHMAFHFPIMPRLFLALRLEDAFPIADILAQTPPIPPDAQWALFLRNHDELTLEMVTHEERDLLLRAYAREPEMRVNLGIRRRLAPLLDNNRRRIELLNALICALPGTPVLYYGDEIGMGDNVYLGDRNGVRTPMQWSPDRNAGFSLANPQRLFLPPILDPEYHYEAINVENQQRNPSSLLWWMKRLIAMRRQHPAFGAGTFQLLASSNRAVFAFVRQLGDSRLLVVANLSRFVQHTELDVSELRGLTPVELFGSARFPRLKSTSYNLSIGPHEFFWFSLEARDQKLESTGALPELHVRESWVELVERPPPGLDRALSSHLAAQRWFRGKGHRLKTTTPVGSAELGDASRLVLIKASFDDQEPETYVSALRLGHDGAHGALARVVGAPGVLGSLVDASIEPDMALRLLALTRAQPLVSGGFRLEAEVTPALARLAETGATARRLAVEQSNTCFVLDDAAICKLSRRLDRGPSVEVEMLSVLNTHSERLHIPKLLGSLKLTRADGYVANLATFTTFLHNQGDAWRLTVDEVYRYFERILARGGEIGKPRRSAPAIEELVGGYLEVARRLGQRTGELHVALASSTDPAFAPVPFSQLERRSAYQSLRTLVDRCHDALENARSNLPDGVAALARSVLKRKKAIDNICRELVDRPFTGRMIRVHGDYHLGQVLYTGSDFAIIDFEGEPNRSQADRRRRRSPLVDVAGMLRSFDYAARGVLSGEIPLSGPRVGDVGPLIPWAEAWCARVSRAFLEAYTEVVAPAGIVPSGSTEQKALLEVFLLEKAVYEVIYEVMNRPTWLEIPLRGVLELTGGLP